MQNSGCTVRLAVCITDENSVGDMAASLDPHLSAVPHCRYSSAGRCEITQHIIKTALRITVALLDPLLLATS